MPKPLMPAVDAAGRLREAAFALLLHHHEPVTLTALADATGVGNEAVRRSLASLAEAGWVDLTDDGLVAGAAGLSLVVGPHRLVVGQRAFRT